MLKTTLKHKKGNSAIEKTNVKEFYQNIINFSSQVKYVSFKIFQKKIREFLEQYVVRTFATNGQNFRTFLWVAEGQQNQEEVGRTTDIRRICNAL